MNEQTTAESGSENRCDMHGSEALNKRRARPFLEALSGRDPLRVMRAGQANGGHDWLPYAWAR